MTSWWIGQKPDIFLMCVGCKYLNGNDCTHEIGCRKGRAREFYSRKINIKKYINFIIPGSKFDL